MRHEEGWALISVLWTIAVLAIIAAAVQSLSYSSAQRERRVLDDAQDSALLDAGIVRAVAGICDPRRDNRWRVDGAVQRFIFGNQILQVTVQDESGRIDLNAADASLLRQLLVSAGISSTASLRMVDRIVEWRSRADTTRPGSPTSSSVENLLSKLRYRPRHGPFQTVAELQLIAGMTPELFARIQPALTVYSGHPAIEESFAPREALNAYFPDQPVRVAALLLARASPTPSVGSSAKPSPGILDVNTGTGHFFDITVSFVGGERVRTREAIVVLTGSTTRPFLVAAMAR